MADVERNLVAKLAHGADFSEALGQGIESHHFADESCRRVWDYIREYTVQYRQQPGFRVLREKFPDHGFEIVEEPIAYVIDEFKSYTKRRIANHRLMALAEELDRPENWDRVDEMVLEMARDLAQAIPSPRIARFSDMGKRWERYKVALASGEMPMGIPTGFNQIDSITYGIQPHEFVSVLGWMGTGKSTLLQSIFFQAYLRDYTPMMFSLEMEAEALFKRWDTMAAKLRYRALRGLELNEEEEERWQAFARKAEEARPEKDILVVDDIGGRFTVDRVYAEMVRRKPDIVGIDYISLMSATGNRNRPLWEQIGDISRDLKQIARSLMIPIVVVAQTNVSSATEGAKLDNISYARSVGADSDISFGLHCTEQMKKNHQMELRLAKNRDGPETTLKLFWDQETKTYEEWSGKHMYFSKKETE